MIFVASPDGLVDDHTTCDPYTHAYGFEIIIPIIKNYTHQDYTNICLVYAKETVIMKRNRKYYCCLVQGQLAIMGLR